LSGLRGEPVECVAESEFTVGRVNALLARAFLELVPTTLISAGVASPGQEGISAMGCICCRQPPAVSLTSAAKAVGCSIPILRSRWRGLGPLGPIRLFDFLGAVALIRALECRRRLKSWDESSALVGAHRRTLERNARKLSGLSLAELTPVPPAILTRQLVRRVWGVWAGSEDGGSPSAHGTASG
jgi:hypothetical protein